MATASQRLVIEENPSYKHDWLLEEYIAVKKVKSLPSNQQNPEKPRELSKNTIYQAGMRISKRIPIKYPLDLLHCSPPMDISAPLNE